ncbi:D-alanine--D-alanine ligase family protein [Micromonospora olivasterospora]|uniref:D-alanine--D-alanine ligase n=1 Tax=Micromonospora olivasterospora TaxID=1880 RepID=A0A562IJ55_MICOL|nr:D-alanine-D-alanine ligase [Micromonospora olivasterospora]
MLFGGRSGEHDVSRRSAESILTHLDRDTYDVTEVLIERDGQWRVNGDRATFAQALRTLGDQDVVFPALHGPYGEDGTVQSMLEWLGVAFVGNGVFTGAAGMDKPVTKKLLAADGLRVAAGVTLRPHEELSSRDQERLGLPVFVKPARAGSSLGVSKVERWAHLPAALRLARESDAKVLVERAVRGREIDVGVLQHPDGRVEAGPPLEIQVATASFFDYDAKYDDGAVFHIPAQLDPGTTGWAGDSRELVINEVNTFPGFTAASQYPQIWQRAGIGFSALLDILIEGALRPRLAVFPSPAAC